MKTFTLFTIFLLSSNFLSSQIKIPLSPDNIIPIYGYSDENGIKGILDEQVLANNPILVGQGGNVQTEYQPVVSALGIHYPYYKIVIDLGTEYNLNNVSIYDGSGIDSLWVKSGNPNNFQSLISMSTNLYNTWRNFSVNTTTRYIEITSKSASSIIKEIVFYGTQIGVVAPPPSNTAHVKPLMKNFLGTNGLHIDNVNYAKCVGFVREYHNAQWDEGNTSTTYPGYPNNQNAWNPSWVSGSGWGWDFDAYYSIMHQNGIETMPCLQGSAPYIQSFNFSNLQHKPTGLTENTYVPSSYIEHGDYLYQFVARYGSNSVSPSNLKLRSTNQPLTGLGNISWIENWNEPDKDWQGVRGYFNAFQYAAMSSADYDGHMGTLGSTIGAKNADPNIKFAMSGIISLNIDYVKALKFWCDHYRNGDFMYDAINFHHYSNDVGGQGSGSPTVGISPEQDSLYNKVKKIVDYRDQFLPGVEVWVSEFGYDTHPFSIQRAPAIGTNDAQEVQGQWLVRSYMALAAAGVDKAMQFMLSDNNGTSGGVYASSGLLYYPGGGTVYTPKKSWYYIYTLKNRLKDFRFDSIISGGTNDVYVYKFKHESDTNKVVYCVWKSSSNNSSVSNYSLNVGNVNNLTCKQVLLNPSSILGDSTDIVISGNIVNIPNVNERPLFIIIDNNCNVIPPTPTISENGPITFCNGDSVVLISSFGTTYQWSVNGIDIAGATDSSYSVTASGEYTVTITNDSGCFSLSSLGTNVVVNDFPMIPIVSTSGSTTFCEGDSVNLTSSFLTNNLWSNNDTNQLVTIYSSGIYTVTVTVDGCSTVSLPIEVVVNQNPNVILNLNQDTVCISSSAYYLNGGEPINGIYNGNGVVSGFFDPFEAGLGEHIITYLYEDSNSCYNEANQTIFVTDCSNLLENELDFSIFPNPAKDYINLNWVSEISRLKIFDSKGKIVFSQEIKDKYLKNINIDIKNFSKGIYVIQLENNEKIVGESKFMLN